MHGMPQAIKDMASTAGLRTTLGLAAAARPRPRRGRPDGRAHEGGRLHRHRQEQHAGVRPRLAHLQRGVRHHPQRLRSEQIGRRQQRRRRGRAGHADAARRRRQRLHGQSAQPRRLEQRVRPSAEPGPRAGVAGRRRLGHPARHRRADGRNVETSRGCSTCRPATTRACRSRSAAQPSFAGRLRDARARALRIALARRPRTAAWRWKPASSTSASRRCGVSKGGLRGRAGGARLPCEGSGAPGCGGGAGWSPAGSRRTWREPGEPRADQARGAVGARQGGRAERRRDDAGERDRTRLLSAAGDPLRALRRPGAAERAGLAVPMPSWRWPKEIDGRTMDTYHRWMEVVSRHLRRPAVLSVPVGFSAAGLPMGMEVLVLGMVLLSYIHCARSASWIK